MNSSVTISPHVTLLTTGSLGDVLPFIALGIALTQAGIRTRVATHLLFEDLVKGHNLEYAPIFGNPKELFESKRGLEFLETGRGSKFLQMAFEFAKRDLKHVSNDSLEAAKGTDLLVYAATTLSGIHVAEKLNIPSVVVGLFPILPTIDFPHIMLTGFPKLGSTINRMTWKLIQYYGWYQTRPATNDWRASVGLKAEGFRGFIKRLELLRGPWLYAFSPSIVPKITDLPDFVSLVGHWQMSREVEYRPEAELLSFLESGPKPIYIGFGSMMKRDSEAFTALVLEAVERAGVRAIISGGWAGLGQRTLPDTVYRVGDCPHEWLFPRVLLAVHHSGAGTVHAACKAGIPSLPAPLFADQVFWSERLIALGVAPKFIPLKELTSETLAIGIQEITKGSSYFENAVKLSSRIRNEDGLGRAVSQIETILKESKN